MTSKDQDIEDYYPDLSDFDSDKEQQPKPPQINPNEKLQKKSIQQTIPKIVAPAFLGGGTFKPPPPSGGRPALTEQKPISEHVQIKGVIPHGYQRQRKNCIYLKNIPKTLNKLQKLTTFFRNFGSIKLIKSNQADKSAMVRFQKEQDALKFLNSKVKIFNRSFIVYDFKEDFQVPQQLVQDCEKDQIANAKTVEHEIIKLREAAEAVIADKYRCLLYLRKQNLSENTRTTIEKQMIQCRKIANADSNDEQVNDMLSNIENQYDWSVVIHMKTKTQIEKKKIIQQFIKYGPIGQVQIRLMSSNNLEDPEQKIGVVKIKFLGVKSSWLMYKQNFSDLEVDVEGRKLKQIYSQWQLNQPQQEHRENIQAEKKEPEMENQKANDLQK